MLIAILQSLNQYQTARPSDPGIGAVIFLIIGALVIVAIAVFTVVMIMVSASRRADRAAKLQSVAQQMRFSFSPKPGLPDFLKNTRYAQWYPAVGTGIHNLLAGNVNGKSVFIFDFGYTQTMGGAGTATYRETIVCIPRDVGEPFAFYRDRTLVAPEHISLFLDAALKAFWETQTHQPVSLAS
ncbi:MAG TPA: hypothetical protein VE961_20735, partial [Pyrinomonadaceae bacterium]|nr:hypothetical protein [Pyrinomonadaceae bacterium]